MTTLKRVSQALALNRQTTLLLAAILTIGSGEEMWMRFLPKYLDVLGASAFLIATFDALKTLLGAIYAYPGGYVTDRFGHRVAFLAFTTLPMAGYLGVVLFANATGVILAMFLFLAWSDFSLPATFSLVAQTLPRSKHAMGVGMQSLIRRIPVIVGPVVGGIVIDRLGMVAGVRTGAGLSMALAALAALLLNQLVRTPGGEPASLGSLRHTVQAFGPELRRLLFSDILIRFCERVSFAWVVMYAMAQGLSAAQVGFLTAIEMMTAIVCYIPASALADRL